MTIPVVSRAQRRTSFDPKDFPMPTGREEEWRFTPLDNLGPFFELAVEADATSPTEREVIELAIDLPPQTRGELVAASDPRLGQASAPGDRAAAVAWTSAQQAVVLTIPTGVTTSEPVTLRLRGQVANPTAVKIAILAEPNARATIVLDHIGHATLNETLELVLERGAHLDVISIQDWTAESLHLASHRAILAQDARLNHTVVTLGGDLVRITPDVAFFGERAEVRLDGLFFADAGQHQEHRLFVDHARPYCKSRVTYKGALRGRAAHSVWVGDVLIRAHAEGTDTYELNRNLLLTEGARADSVPNLEIETGQIAGAGHASATGRFDDDQLFYLMSRGIPESDARRLVVRGFFAELIDRIEVPEVRHRLLESIERELGPPK